VIRSNYADHQTPQFKVLTNDQCYEIYLSALECLNRIGVIVNYEPARQLLDAAGARIEDNRVYIPPNVIQEALVTTPRTFTLWGRDHLRQIRVAPDRVHFGPGPTCTYFYDPFSGERRKARRGDAAMTAKVCDALENVDFAMSLSQLDDVNPLLSPVYEFFEMITNTSKPIIAWSNNIETLSSIYQMAVAVAGDKKTLQNKPIFALFATYESPLRHPQSSLENLLWAADHDIPVIYLGGPTEGIESPFTGASALVIHLAAVLSGLAMVQLKKRGAPMVIGGIPSAMDLRTSRPAYGSPEMMLHVAAAADLARYLGVPFMGTAGASESKLVDPQAAIEISLQILMSTLSGASLVHDVGFLDCADIGSLSLLVMADEVIAMTARIMRGLQVNQETIMLDLIEKVGPGGHFLTESQSVSLCRSEIWVPKLSDRDPYLIWQGKGEKSMHERINAKLLKILDTHQPPPLTQDALNKIKTILSNAEGRV
jgi:trimethylamine--corrinoid protein Co-methyltransferase